jgi:uncharacterized membrane protein YfcA
MMAPSDVLSLLSGAAVGLVLALIGGGGSILATPALLYVVGVTNPHVAIGTGALAVSVNAFINLIIHSRRGNVNWPCALAFAGAGIVGAAIGAALGKLTDAQILLPLFALVMIAAGVRMLKAPTKIGGSDVALSISNAPRIAGAGLAVGALSGFFGIGGGFLIVPGLMAASGMAMLHAVGSSLVSVGAFGATTAASYAYDRLVDWRVAGLFVAGGIFGGLVGASLSSRLATHKNALQRVFAGVVFTTAIYMLWRSFGP